MIERLVRDHLKRFQPYRSARSEVSDAKIFLDANELALGSPISLDGVSLHRYPDPYQNALRKKIGERLNLSTEMIFLGVGSDEIIDLLIRLFCEPSKDSVAILEPTYGVYRVAADLSAVQVVDIQLDNNFQIDVEQTLSSILPSTKIVFCCSPNNPTGNLLRRDDILLLCRKVDAVVVVDEAYIEFADRSGDLSNDVIQHDNLVVLRTLSKAWGLAGIRLGYCIAHPAIVSYLLRIKLPYNVNVLTSRFALDALEKEEFLSSSTSYIIQERTRLTVELKKIADVVRVYPSEANFLLVEFRNPHNVYEKLAGEGIIVRRRSEPRLNNCLRLTIGTKTENNRLLQCLAGNG